MIMMVRRHNANHLMAVMLLAALVLIEGWPVSSKAEEIVDPSSEHDAVDDDDATGEHAFEEQMGEPADSDDYLVTLDGYVVARSPIHEVTRRDGHIYFKEKYIVNIDFFVLPEEEEEEEEGNVSSGQRSISIDIYGTKYDSAAVYVDELGYRFEEKVHIVRLNKDDLQVMAQSDELTP